MDDGEARFSGTSADDMGKNLVGIGNAYDIVLAAAVARADPSLDQTIDGQIDQLGTVLEVSHLKAIDSTKLRSVGEAPVLSLRTAAPKIGLMTPTLEDIGRLIALAPWGALSAISRPPRRAF